MQNETKTFASIVYARSLFDGLVEAARAQDGACFSRRLEGVIKAVSDIGAVHAYELEMAGVQTRTAPATQRDLADKAVVAGAVSLARKASLKKMGLDGKFIGVRNETEMQDVLDAEKAGK